MVRACFLALTPLVIAGELAAAVLVDPPPRGSLNEADITAFITRDPQEAAAWGQAIFQHEFSAADGAGESVLHPGLQPMRVARAFSCMLCHNVPFGTAGAGATIGRGGPAGRSTPHAFGVGVRERLAEALTTALIAAVDQNGDGTVSEDEAHNRHATFDPDGSGPAPAVDFGWWDDRDNDGRPDLDPGLESWWADADGCRLPRSPGARPAAAVGWRIALRPFGWTALDRDSLTDLRGFTAGAFTAHAGLAEKPNGGITSGEVDLVVWYLRQHQAPREALSGDDSAHIGKNTFNRIGCTTCHVDTWQVSEIAVRGLYSDMRHHDLGPAFYETRFDGSTTQQFRTPPLWGVAHSAPYGHDGASLDLDTVIRRHGGEAAHSSSAYAELSHGEQVHVLDFLRSLVLNPN